MSTKANAQPLESKEASSTNASRVQRVDQFWSKQKRQWLFKKTSKSKAHGDRFKKYVLVARRIITLKGLVQRTEVDIKSDRLAAVLSDILTGVTGLQLNQTPPMILPETLFHCKDDLLARLEQERLKSDADEQLTEDIATALEFIHEEFASRAANLESLVKHGEITYDLLWGIFKPSAAVFTEANTLREPQGGKFSSGTYVETSQGNWYAASVDIIHSDGDDIGWGTTQIIIRQFEGTRKLTSLEVYPMAHHAEPEKVHARLVERGRKFVQVVVSPVCQEYVGYGILQEIVMQKQKEKRFTAVGRMMVDPTAFQNRNPNDDLLIEPYVDPANATDLASLPEDQLIFCSHRVLGFSFTQKRWGAFAVSGLTDVVWDETAFDKLILEERKRSVISMLVRSHKADDLAFDDVVKGKGKGLVGLLSGSPGAGKTLTAETIAELSNRPLYAISAGELGTKVTEVDDKLGVVLEISHRWGCVLLIDEADVFLFKRGDGQLERNALVSVFLRRLEYFQGIVILTTNRRKDIDDAFKSRIHFKFYYPPLGPDGRLKIWKNLLDSVLKGMKGVELDEDELSKLAEMPMNGREIKNAVSCAASIVRAGNEPLTVKLVREIVESFTDERSDEE